MPSLLDLYAMRNPALGGLLGGGPSQPQTPQGLPDTAGPQIGGGLLGGSPRPPQASPQSGLLGGGPSPQAPRPEPQQRPQPQQAPPQQPNLQALFKQAGAAVGPRGQKPQKLDARETIINTGLALLSSGGQRANFGQALAAGLFAGRQAAAQNNQARQIEAQAQQRAQRYLAVLGEGEMTRAKIDQALKVATISGDTDTLKVLKDIRGQFPEDPDVSSRKHMELPDGSVGFVDAGGRVWDADGNQMTSADISEIVPEEEVDWEIRSIGNSPVRFDANTGIAKDFDGNVLSAEQMRRMAAADETVSYVLRKMEREDGTTVEVLFNPRTGQNLAGSEQIVSRGDTTDSANPQIAGVLRRELGNLRGAIGDDPNTPETEGADEFRGRFFSRFGGVLRGNVGVNAVKPAEVQVMEGAANNILSIILKERSGATVSEPERERLEQVILPRAGDTVEAVEAKLQRVQEMIDAYESNGADAAMNQYFSPGGAYIFDESEAIAGFDDLPRGGN